VPTAPHIVHTRSGPLLELPLATTQWLGVTVPAAGGAYLRILPLTFVVRGLREWTRRGHPAMLYIHPWELDEEQPRLPVAWHAAFRHYHGVSRTLPRLRRLVSAHRFGDVRRVYQLATPRDDSGAGA
jgi:hypothetical protein